MASKKVNTSSHQVASVKKNRKATSNKETTDDMPSYSYTERNFDASSAQFASTSAPSSERLTQTWPIWGSFDHPLAINVDQVGNDNQKKAIELTPMERWNAEQTGEGPWFKFASVGANVAGDATQHGSKAVEGDDEDWSTYAVQGTDV